MKFLCDAMLAHVGKRLREAGYDTRIDAGLLTDYELVLLAQEEGRFLLSADRAMNEIKAAEGLLVYLPSQREADWAARLKALGVDWLRAPFTRCLECNCLLEPAAEGAWEEVPETVRTAAPEIRRCPQCHKLFWEGSHVRSMRARLERLNAPGPPP